MDISRVSVFYLSSDGGDWALYLQHKFATKEYSLETVLNDLMCDSSFHTRSSRLNVFLVTPNFLDSYVHFRYLEKFERRNSILILTGIDYDDFKMEAQSRDCAYVLDWMIHELNDGGEESVRDLMIKIIEVYEGHGDFEEQGKGGSRFSEYDTLPIVASRQVNTVLDIVQKGDIVYILLDRPPEGPITAKFPRKSVTPEYLDEASVFRFDCTDVDDDEFAVVSDSIELSQGTLEDRRESQEVYCVPSNLRASVATQTDTGTEPETDISQVIVGRVEELYDNEDLYDRVDEPLDKQSPRVTEYAGRTKLEVINQILEEEACPEKLLCKALEIEIDIEVLDNKLAAMIEGVGELRNLSLLSEVQTTDASDQTVWPSLLHFGAQYNLKKFCTILAENRLIHRACTVPNKHGLKPNELAQKYGHTELANMLLEIAKKDAENNAKCDSGSYDADSYRASRASDSSEPEEPFPCTLSYEPSRYDRQHTHSESSYGRQRSAIDRPGGRDSSEHLSHSLTEPKGFSPKQQALSQSMPRTEVQLPTKPHKKGFLGKILGHHHKKPEKPEKAEKPAQRQRSLSVPTIKIEDLERLSRIHEEAVGKQKMTHYHPEPDLPAPPMCKGPTLKLPEGLRSRPQCAQVQRVLVHEQGQIVGNRRSSIRLAHAMSDKSLKGPKLPHRRQGRPRDFKTAL